MVDYNTQTTDNPNLISRFAHRSRNNISIKIINKIINNEKKTLLDYGCGNGYLLKELSKTNPMSTFIGYDKYSKIQYKPLSIINNMENIDDKSIDVFCCFETLEHLNEDEFKILFLNIKRLIKDSAKIIISIPIIGGPTLIIKEISRMILFKRKSDYNFKELFLASFFGINAQRAENIKTSHKGFNFKKLKYKLQQKFNIISIIYSPFKFLPWIFNSQVFYIMELVLPNENRENK